MMSKGDGKGYMRGAKGIDGTKDCGFEKKNISSSAVNGMYGRSWSSSISQSEGTNDITGESK